MQHEPIITDESGPPGRRTALALAAIVALAVAVRAGWIAYANVNPLDGRHDDTVFYYLSAQSLAGHLAFRDEFGRLTAHWPPGYPMLLAPIFATLGTRILLAKALNVALSAAACVLTYVLGARAFGRGTGLLAALLLALFPGHIYFSTLIMTEVAFGFVFLTVVAMLLFWTVDSRARWWQIAAIGAVTGYLTLIRAEAVFLPPAIALFWLLATRDWRTTARYSAIFALAFAAVLTPWTVRNAVRFHAFVPLRDGAPGAISNGLDRNYLNRPDRFSAPAPPIGDTGGYIARHPWEFVPLQIDKLRYLYRNDSDGIDWLQHERPLLTPSEVRRWSRVANIYFFAVGAAALLATPLLLRRLDRRRFLIAYMLAAWTAIEIITWPESRYHLPVLPLMSVLAAATITTAHSSLARDAEIRDSH